MRAHAIRLHTHAERMTNEGNACPLPSFACILLTETAFTRLSSRGHHTSQFVNSSGNANGLRRWERRWSNRLQHVVSR